MKNFVLVLLMAVVIVSCKKGSTSSNETISSEGQNDRGYSISGKAIGFSDQTTVYVNAVSASNRPVIIDSTKVQNGEFSIQLPSVEQKDLNYLTFSNHQGNVLFLAENNPIDMTIYRDSLRASKIKGGRENDLFFQYVGHVNEQPKKFQKLSNQIHIATKLKEAEKLADLKKQQQQLTENSKRLKLSLIQDNPSFITPVFVLLDMVKQNKITAKEAKGLFSNLDPSIQNTRLGKTLDQMIAAAIGKIDVGSEAEDFSALTPNGDQLSLKEAMGKVTIIDFWASWCRPCRMENPHVVDLYNTYHKKGLNIIGVSLDGNKGQWIKAIEDDHLTWQHVSNLQKWQEPIARAYGVRSIPATFILDENGVVVAKNLRGQALSKKIAELLDGEAL